MDKKSHLFLQLWHTAIREGVLATLGATNLHTLIGLAYFMNEQGECYPSESRLMSLLGLSDVSSVSDRITKLRKAQWNNKPVIQVKTGERTKDKSGKYKWGNNYYKLNMEIISIFSGWQNNQTET